MLAFKIMFLRIIVSKYDFCAAAHSLPLQNLANKYKLNLLANKGPPSFL